MCAHLSVRVHLYMCHYSATTCAHVAAHIMNLQTFPGYRNPITSMRGFSELSPGLLRDRHLRFRGVGPPSGEHDRRLLDDAARSVEARLIVGVYLGCLSIASLSLQLGAAIQHVIVHHLECVHQSLCSYNTQAHLVMMRSCVHQSLCSYNMCYERLFLVDHHCLASTCCCK